MDRADYQDIINEYKEQVRVLKAQISELEDACKSKDAALKRSLQKLCLLYTSPSPRDGLLSRMPSSA